MGQAILLFLLALHQYARAKDSPSHQGTAIVRCCCCFANLLIHPSRHYNQSITRSIDQAVPDDRLLLESDQDSLARALPEILELCKIGTSLLPIAWFAPVPAADTSIASLHIFLSLRSAVAEEKGWSIEQVAQITCDNAERFFNAGSHSLPDISTVEQESPRHE